MKILLLLIISTFFMPFLSVSCSSPNINISNLSNLSNTEISVSGIGMAMGTEKIFGEEISSNPAAFALIIPAAVLFIISFINLPVVILSVAYITAAFINAVMAFGIIMLIKSGIEKRIIGEFGGLFNDALKINIKYGFIIYIICNIILLFAGIFWLIKFFRIAVHESRNSDSDIAEID